MTEDQLLESVIRLCDRYRLLYFHSGDSRKDRGQGFPDLVIAGSVGTAFVELKSADGSYGPGQSDWKWRLLSSGEKYFLWRPRDLDGGTVKRELWKLRFTPEEVESGEASRENRKVTQNNYHRRLRGVAS